MSRIVFKSIIIIVTLLVSCKNNEIVQNSIEILSGDSQEDIIQKSVLVVPKENQYAWQQLEFIAFVHFGPNTFTGVEWGSGKEDPNVFQPTEFNPKQWVDVMKDAGMKMVMLTAKHHDGFCLWPTSTTPHSVKSTSWKDGKGDVFGDLVKAARNEGLKVGVYLSPADLSEIERKGGTYGNHSKPKSIIIPSDKTLKDAASQTFEYIVDDYNALFLNQLYELLTQYGDIVEVWFDGANPKPGLGQEYDRKTWYDLIKKLQPNATIAVKGADVRWCGNEAGKTRSSEWSVVPLPVHPDNYDWPDMTDDDLGSREKIKDAEYLYWYPAETNTSIRMGWFYRDDEQYVKTVETLVDNWYRSVGGNTVFLLNITPDRRGLIPEKDALRLQSMGKIIKEAFAYNLSKNASVKASSIDYNYLPENAIDGNMESAWKAMDGQEQAELELTLMEEKEVNRIVLQECIKTLGQRIEKFTIEAKIDEEWKEIVNGTTIGYKNISRFKTIKTNKLKLKILASRVSPAIAAFEIYNAPEMLTNPIIVRNKEGLVTISCKSFDPVIYYTTDGSQPDQNSILYTKPFLMDQGGLVKAVSYVNEGNNKSETIEARLGVCPAKWQVLSFSAEQKLHEAVLAIDGDPQTYWHTQWGDNPPQNPHDIIVGLGEELDLTGFTYLPRNDGLGGICKSYVFEVSMDGKNWEIAKKGEFGNIKNNPINQMMFFSKIYKAKYIRFTSLDNINGDAYLSMAELGVLTNN
ncbi:alpha-L-fucosidase [Sabulilitoribacter arenilitoris]|uniref:alpha-L-fucosidase n=1 Tax=Wocania arenilitoris TaxID=2044858 RepID=A0AAE3JLX3_9FLAO|nr:alpha-L-fucosidase [Wocania arenilitoris]MCF7568779.1 alpha-L-fucosidase [Wocania arenilitoris]